MRTDPDAPLQDVESLARIEQEIGDLAISLHAYAERWPRDGIDRPLVVKNFKNLMRGLRYIKSFVEAVDDSRVEELEKKGQFRAVSPGVPRTQETGRKPPKSPNDNHENGTPTKGAEAKKSS
jgi:hypothetical protein